MPASQLRGRALYHLEQAHVDALEDLIAKLEKTEPLTQRQAGDLREAHLAKHRFDFVALADKSEAEVQAALATFNEKRKEARKNDPLAHLEWGDEAKKERRSNILENIQVASASFDFWMQAGELPAPAYPRRIGVLLRKAKRIDLDARFTAAWRRHHWMALPPTVEKKHDEMLDALRLQTLQSAIPKLSISVKDIIDEGDGGYEYRFEFHCLDCGGFVLSVPDDRAPEGPVDCKACGERLGTYQALVDLAGLTGDREAKRRGLPSRYIPSD